jgi:hypothetical protein
VGVGIAVEVAVAGETVGIGELVGDRTGSGVAGSAVGCVPQADSNKEKVKKK